MKFLFNEDGTVSLWEGQTRLADLAFREDTLALVITSLAPYDLDAIGRAVQLIFNPEG
jgi:hypothetical protein